MRFPGEVLLDAWPDRPHGWRPQGIEPATDWPGYRRTCHVADYALHYWAPWWIAWLYRVLPRSLGIHPRADWQHAQFQGWIWAASWRFGCWVWPLGVVLCVGPLEFAWYSQRYCRGRSGDLKIPWWGLVRWSPPATFWRRL